MEDTFDDVTFAPQWGVQAAGALRGALIGVARVITRPAQMKVFIWLMKRKWSQQKGGARLHFRSNVLVEAAIGSLMYDVYDRTLKKIDEQGAIPKAAGVYGSTMCAGMVAGLTCVTFSTAHNNIVQYHADTSSTLYKAVRNREITLCGKHGVFRGLRRAALRDSIASGVMFTATRWFKTNLPQPPADSLLHTTLQASVAGGLAGMTASLVGALLQKPDNWSTQYALSHLTEADTVHLLRLDGAPEHHIAAVESGTSRCCFLPFPPQC
ncbi:hypothetical protein DIPPA_35978 [Diplonema papillatum]|nr:hypothetical protein DIPPA_35978 [Diplonema papillatum]